VPAHDADREPYFDATADAPLEAFAAEARRHPVFRVVEPKYSNAAPATDKDDSAVR
jgi:hypothetical protein